MRNKQSLLILISVLLVCLLAGRSLARAPQPQARLNDSGPSVSKPKAPAKTLTELRVSETPDGTRVTISADFELDDYATYKRAGHFVVIIPDADASAIRGGLSRRGLLGIKVEPEGSAVAVSFPLPPASSVQVSQQSNRLEVTIGSADAAATTAPAPANFTATRAAEPAQAEVETAAAPPVTAPSAGQPPSAASGGGQPPMPQGLFDALVSKFLPNTEADALNLDLNPPEPAANAALGITPQTVIRPGTPREFGSSLINSLDENGNFQTGLSLEAVPFMLFNGPNVAIQDYQNQRLTRLLSRTSFSLAVTKGATDDDLSTRLAGGVSVTLWDRGDPRIFRRNQPGDVLTCFVNRLQFAESDTPIPPTATPEEVAEILATRERRLKPIADECRDEGRKARWNRSSFVIAYAPSWISKSGQSSDFKWNGGAFWSSLAYGFEEYPSLSNIAQLIVHARYRSKEQAADSDNEGQFITRDTFFLGGRLRAGGPAFALNFEDAFVRHKPVGGSADSSNRFSIGAEARLADNLYFVISAGGNVGRNDGNKGFVLTSFKYGFNRKPQFERTPQ